MAEMFHLPDLPIAGYATEREKEATDSVMLFMRAIDRNRLRMLCIVLEGPAKWRAVAAAEFGQRVAREHSLLDDIFVYFQLQAAGSAPAMQVEMLRSVQNPAKFRDYVTALTPHWELERDKLLQMQHWSPMDGVWTIQ